jgi:hypothetical protein
LPEENFQPAPLFIRGAGFLFPVESIKVENKSGSFFFSFFFSFFVPKRL